MRTTSWLKARNVFESVSSLELLDSEVFEGFKLKCL